MDEKDREIQALRRRLEKISEENDAMLGELIAIEDCTTCEHYHECNANIYHYRYSYREACKVIGGYKWRGVDAYNDWAADRENMRRLEEEVNAEIAEMEFERRMGETE